MILTKTQFILPILLLAPLPALHAAENASPPKSATVKDADAARADALAVRAPVRWAVGKVFGPGTADGFPLIEGVDHIELMHVTPATGTYSHHAHILHDGNRFYAAWSSHLGGEDSPGQRVLYTMSDDGRHWMDPKECFPSLGPWAQKGVDSRVLTANGLHQIDGVVYAIAGVNDLMQSRSRRRIVLGNIARTVQPDGTLGPMFWLSHEAPAPFEGFVFNIPGGADPRFATAAEKIIALRKQPGHIPSWSFQPGGIMGDDHTVPTGNWRSFGGTMRADDKQLMCEPTSYRRPDGTAVRLYRDHDGSHRIYAAIYDEARQTWTAPHQTSIPDSPSRAVAGRLPNGGIYLVGNQTWVAMEGKGGRDPLVLSVSRDGVTFDRAWIIRAGSPPMRYAGASKGRGFQYPHATVVGNALCVIYSINKEDVAVTRVPLQSVMAAMGDKPEPQPAPVR